MIVLVYLIVLLRELLVSTIFCMVHPYIAIHSVEWFLHLYIYISSLVLGWIEGSATHCIVDIVCFHVALSNHMALSNYMALSDLTDCCQATN